MVRSLGMAAYLALAARQGHAEYVPSAPRASGRVIWGHAATGADAQALLHLFERLNQVHSNLQLLLTHDPEVAGPPEFSPICVREPAPPENRDAVAAFLDHWRPDLCIWTRGDLRPALIAAASDRGVAMYLVNARVDAFELRGMRWLPDLVKKSVRAFDEILVVDTAARNRLLRLGLSPDDVTVAGALQEGGVAPPCDETAHHDLTVALQGRPAWLAAMVHPDELSVTTEAHRAALRLAHRLLLVIVPDDAADESGFAATLDDEGWRVARWSRGELPGETTQILLVDGPGEMGLWYRLAPVSFLGGSIVSGAGGHDPYQPAALGSAILYGPNVGGFLGAYSRLAGAGAARIVKDAPTLAAAVSQLNAPDHAAQMAHAAWEVVSDGAEVTDRLLALVEDTLDVLGAEA